MGCYEPILISEVCETTVDDAFVKSYFDFEVGTLWVYREVNSGELDSVEVIYHTPRFPSNPVDFCWLASCSNRHYNYYQNYYEDDHGIVNNQINGCPRNVVFAGYERPGGNRSGCPAFYIGANKKENLPLDVSFFLEEEDALDVNGVNYSNVLVYLISSDGCFGYDSVKYHIADHYGIVRFENLINDECWDLISSEIIKE